MHYNEMQKTNNHKTNHLKIALSMITKSPAETYSGILDRK